MNNVVEIFLGVIALAQLGGITVIGYLVNRINYLTIRIDSLAQDVNRIMGATEERDKP